MLNRLIQALEWKKVRMVIQYAVYMLLVMLLQSVLFSRISIFGAKGFIIPAAAVAAGIYLGGVRGAVFGIFLGLFTDMAFSETTVLFTILFPIHTIFFFMLYSILTMGEDVNQTHEKRDAPFVVSFFVS